MRERFANAEICARVYQSLITAPMPTSVNVRRAMPDVHSSIISNAFVRLEEAGYIKKIESKPATFKILEVKE